MQGVLHTNWLLLTPQQQEAEQQLAITKLKECLTGKYLQLSAQHGFKLKVVLHPMQQELEQNSFGLQPLADLLAGEKRLEVINLFEAYQQAKQQRGIDYAQLYWPCDGHHNSEGYKLWAEIVAARLAADTLP